jgi:hypothetical protein
VLHNQSISYSQLPSICITDNHAAGRTTGSWRLTVVSWSAALAAVDEKVTTTADLLRVLRVKIKGARSICCLVHFVFAVG